MLKPPTETDIKALEGNVRKIGGRAASNTYGGWHLPETRHAREKMKALFGHRIAAKTKRDIEIFFKGPTKKAVSAPVAGIKCILPALSKPLLTLALLQHILE